MVSWRRSVALAPFLLQVTSKEVSVILREVAFDTMSVSGFVVLTITEGSPKTVQVSAMFSPSTPYSSIISIHPLRERPAKVRFMLSGYNSERIFVISSCPAMGEFQLWLIVDPRNARAPVG